MLARHHQDDELYLSAQGSPSLNLHLPRLHPGRGNNPTYIQIQHKSPGAPMWLMWLTWAYGSLPTNILSSHVSQFPPQRKDTKAVTAHHRQTRHSKGLFWDFVSSCWWVNPIPRGGDRTFTINVERKIPWIFDRWKKKQQHTTSMAEWLTDFIHKKWCLSINFVGIFFPPWSFWVQKNVLSKSPTLLLL